MLDSDSLPVSVSSVYIHVQLEVKDPHRISAFTPALLCADVVCSQRGRGDELRKVNKHGR